MDEQKKEELRERCMIAVFSQLVANNVQLVRLAEHHDNPESNVKAYAARELSNAAITARIAAEAFAAAMEAFGA